MYSYHTLLARVEFCMGYGNYGESNIYQLGLRWIEIRHSDIELNQLNYFFNATGNVMRGTGKYRKANGNCAVHWA
jgi:hypothetical protein